MENQIAMVAISAFIGAVVAAVGAAIQNALSLRAKIDESFRTARLDAYKPLWKMTDLLPKWPKAPHVTYAKLDGLHKGLRDWYFDNGGIYLSEEARKTYETVQETLSQLVERNRDKADTNISNEEYEAARKTCSALRTELTGDLQSRRRSFLTG